MMGQIGDVSEMTEKIQRLEEILQRVTLRLDQSERGNRRMRLAAAGVLIAAVLLIAAGAAQLSSRVARLDVVGPNNDVRVSISVNPDNGSAGMEVFGTDGRRVVFLGTSANGTPNLSIYDPSGERVIRSVAP
jgi:hypothetical protein